MMFDKKQTQPKIQQPAAVKWKKTEDSIEEYDEDFETEARKTAAKVAAPTLKPK